ncbi:hypothetical protein C8J56DRAFT_1062648 [Mycena floridula]|nr:hypothetical protein C8J56DRAFT_1062648 [Mycena floridula]
MKDADDNLPSWYICIPCGKVLKLVERRYDPDGSDVESAHIPSKGWKYQIVYADADIQTITGVSHGKFLGDTLFDADKKLQANRKRGHADSDDESENEMTVTKPVKKERKIVLPAPDKLFLPASEEDDEDDLEMDSTTASDIGRRSMSTGSRYSLQSQNGTGEASDGEGEVKEEENCNTIDLTKEDDSDWTGRFSKKKDGRSGSSKKADDDDEFNRNLAEKIFTFC